MNLDSAVKCRLHVGKRMKKRLLKNLAPALVGSLCAVGAANANPMSEGGINMSGTFTHVNPSNISVGIAAATEINFGWAFLGAADTRFGIATAGRSFSSLVGGPLQSFGTIANFPFDLFAPTPGAGLWSAGDLSFEMSSLTWDKGSSVSNNDFHIHGLGMMSVTGYHNKLGVWNFAGQGGKDTHFLWSIFATATSVPEYTTMVVFGIVLVVLGGAKLRKKRK